MSNPAAVAGVVNAKHSVHRYPAPAHRRRATAARPDPDGLSDPAGASAGDSVSIVHVRLEDHPDNQPLVDLLVAAFPVLADSAHIDPDPGEDALDDEPVRYLTLSLKHPAR